MERNARNPESHLLRSTLSSALQRAALNPNMSFQFPDWTTAFSPGFHESAKAMLEGALNKVRSRIWTS